MVENLEYYNTFFYNVLLLVVLLVYANSLTQELTSRTNLKGKKFLGFLLLGFVILYMGLRPISFFFGDMGMYDQELQKYQAGALLNTEKDVLFQIFLQACSKIMTRQSFFLLCAALYVVPLYIASKKLFKDYWFYAFLMLVISFSFWSYGTNGIRNGIATSFFILGISRDKKIFVALWMILALCIHKSLMLPIAAYIVVLIYNKPKIFLILWFLAIPISLASGAFWESFFLKLGFGEEDRLAGYLGDEALDLLNDIKVGFRWDFLLYSFSGVATGWYFIIKKQFRDIFYDRIYSVYLIANGIWVLLIRANFSNRFAYLSWFLLGIVIIYPLIKNQIFKKQHQIIGSIILIYFIFTYILNVILV